jgi:hypothetical protein
LPITFDCGYTRVLGTRHKSRIGWSREELVIIRQQVDTRTDCSYVLRTDGSESTVNTLNEDRRTYSYLYKV